MAANWLLPGPSEAIESLSFSLPFSLSQEKQHRRCYFSWHKQNLTTEKATPSLFASEDPSDLESLELST